jgi:hypothetical protein
MTGISAGMVGDVRAQSFAVAAMAAEWPILDGLTGGTRAMRRAGRGLLPQFPAEDDGAYQTRLGSAVLTNFFARTCAVMAAKPFSQAVNSARVAPGVAEWLSDIDGQGTEMPGFAETLLRGCLSHGIGGVLVDYPEADAAITRAEEKAGGIRPFWAYYPAAAILGCKADRSGGEWKLRQLRLLEMVAEEDGRFAEMQVEQVRVLEPGLWEVWRRCDATQSEWMLHSSGTTTLDFVPFQFFYGTRAGFGVGGSPLLDLAYLNGEHWQSSSDQQTILHVARVPILFGKGFDPNSSIRIGASSAVIVAEAGADLKFVEHGGHAIDAGRQSILDLEDRMRQLGAELLVKQRANPTATQVLSEGQANVCLLQSIVQNFEDGLNACLDFTARWLGDETDSRVELFKDFGVDSLSDASAGLLLDAAKGGLLSAETWFAEMQRRTIIDADRDWAGESLTS